MPNYVTHAVMGEIINIPNKNILIDKSYLKVFNLGQDLLSLISGGNERTHNEYTSLFFYKLIKYIIDNKLYENKKVMAYLYGNIMHYELDKTIHPFIYYMTNDIPRISLISFHTASEEYLGDILLYRKLKLSRKDFVKNIKKIKFSNDFILRNMIDTIYSKIYGYKYASISMNELLSSFKLVNRILNHFNKNDNTSYFNFIGLFRYMKKYLNMTSIRLLNDDHQTWLNPVNGIKSNLSFTELFDQATASSQEVMAEVDKIIYDNKNLANLNKLFENLSYDTGLDCNIGKPFKYSYVKTLKK